MRKQGIVARVAGRTLVGVLLAVGVSACFEHTYIVGRGAPEGRMVYDHWQNHWLGGLISPNQTLELREMCPSGNATIHEEATFMNGLIGALTGGIYQPTTVKVRCADGGRADLEFTAEDVERIVSDPAFLMAVQAIAPARFEEAAAAQEALQDR
jgi:Bor protein